MAKEPVNLILEQLKILRSDVHGMRGDVRDIRKVLDAHTLKLDFLDERVETLREGTLTAIGFAASAGVQHKKLEKRIVDLARRVEKLEKAR